MRKTILVFVLILAAASLGAEPREVTAKEVEVFGLDMAGKSVCMVGEFEGISQAWPNYYEIADSSIGFWMDDSKGEFFQYALAEKSALATTLLDLKKGDAIRACGEIRLLKDKMGKDNAFLQVTSIIR